MRVPCTACFAGQHNACWRTPCCCQHTGNRGRLVGAAWAELEAARTEYHAEVRRLRAANVSKRKATQRARLKGYRHRLTRAWLWLHELGLVDLRNRRGGDGFPETPPCPNFVLNQPEGDPPPGTPRPDNHTYYRETS